MLASPAAAATTSHATVCSLRAKEHGPPNHAPRSPSRRQPSHPNAPLSDVALDKPPQVLLTRQDTSYDPAAFSLDDDCLPPSPARGHPKAYSTAFLDSCRPLVHRATSSLSAFQNQSRASLPSPTKSFASFIPSRRDPAPLPDEQTPRVSALGDWFSGSSAPFTLSRDPRHDDDESDIGSDSDLDSDDDYDDTMDGSHSQRNAAALGRTKSLKRASTQSFASNNSQPPPATSNFLSWFTRKSDAPKNGNNLPQDPLSVLDIESALFPNGQPDPLDPHAFHDLHKASVALLKQFQMSYKAMQLCMQDTRLEEDGLREEKKQADVHAQNLQMQLDNLKADAEKRDKEMSALRDALERERQLRADEEEARIASLRAVRGPGCKCNRKSTASCTITTEPNGVLSDRDSGFESEGETVTDDFAHSRPTSMLSDSDIPELDSNPSSAPTSAPSPVEPSKPTLFKRKGTFDTALQKKRDQRNSQRGSVMPIILTGAGKMADNNGQMDVWRENRELRERVEALERTVDEALGIVGGLEAGIVY
ncbi:hypothetical protein MPH_12806 [Macrophomina phaseolina MS6]|uniref:Uncharacterized protein n=1 Tax=Macrophomina phaseolina (strain MS6) TaxID=1126212 RepID=K2QK37_MACPH|nr:hypothetical protein MPH_12806 [Macrophomina phaseolina MS6]